MKRSALAFILVLAGCGGASFDSTVQAKLLQAVQTSPHRIDLAEYVPSDWQRVCVLTAATSRQSFEQLIGAEWSGFEAPDAEHVTLVFMRNGVIAEATELERRRGDFAAAGGSYCLPRDSAVFRVADTQAAEYRPVVPLR